MNSNKLVQIHYNGATDNSINNSQISIGMPYSTLTPEQYTSLLAEKQSRISKHFAEFSPPGIEVHDSPPLNFRMRAEFRLWHDDNDCYFVMFEPGPAKKQYRIDQLPIASKQINELMPNLLNEIRESEDLRKKLFQVEFLSTLSGECLISLIYHRALGTNWEQKAHALADKLQVKIIGRSKKQKLVLTDDYVTERLSVNGRSYVFRQIEGGFTQPNAIVNQKMLEWVDRHSRSFKGDALELYCGNGNFTVVLANNFHRVLATEISKTSVRSALWNFAHNRIDNVKIVRMSSEELTEAFEHKREFRRLQDIKLDDYRFSTILVDPPRAGLDKKTEQLVSRFDQIVYISCNPETLHNNLRGLCQSHQIEHFAIFDQFPYTDHIESGVILSKRR